MLPLLVNPINYRKVKGIKLLRGVVILLVSVAVKQLHSYLIKPSYNTSS